jgi:hypothetical protein
LLVAVTVIAPGEVGAVNVAAVAVCAVTVPLDAVHVTPMAATSFVTVAVRFKACPTTTPPRFGVIVTLTAGLLTVIAAVAAFVVSAAEVAVSVTPAGGVLAGAV